MAVLMGASLAPSCSSLGQANPADDAEKRLLALEARS